MERSDIIRFYIDNGVLIAPELLSRLESEPFPIYSGFCVITPEVFEIILQKKQVEILDFEQAIVQKQKHKDTKMYDRFVEYFNTSQSRTREVLQTVPSTNSASIQERQKNNQDNIENSTKIEDNAEKEREEFLKRNRIEIVSSYKEKSRTWSVYDFVGLYNSRFKDIEKILRSRQELQSLTSISRINSKKEKENVALIGMVYDKVVTKLGNIMLTLEDPTGMIKVVITQKKEEPFRIAEEIQLDEIIGISGMYDKIVFANNLFIPDVPLTKELKKSLEEGYLVLISDTQVGSKLFLEKEFNKFLAWLNGEIGTDKQKEVASKVKYIFMAGDLVDGVGIYPNQEYDLSVIDISSQYSTLAAYLKRIPSHLPIIFCLGNHDVGRISEPQPALWPEYAKELIEMPNVVPVSNPSIVNIFADPKIRFDGLDVMLYHGGSFVFYSEAIPTIRKSGAQKRPDLIIKYLLQRRHLAPTHSSTLFVPNPKKDPLVIDRIPDFIFSGHIHRSSVSNYRNVTCINASCWVSKSDEQERRGLDPQPARAFIIDLHTREVKIMNFLSREDQEKESEGEEQAQVNAA